MTRLAIAAAVLLCAGAAAADPAEGVWQTAPDDNGNFGHVEMAPCGAALCGTLVRAYNSAGARIESPNVGRRIVWDMEPAGGGSYRNGQVYAPDRDRTYRSRMELDGDRLTVEGCVLGICRSGGTWVRVN